MYVSSIAPRHCKKTASIETIHNNLQIFKLRHSHIVWSKNFDNGIAYLIDNATDSE